MTKSRTLAGGICLLGIVGLCFAICADTGKKTPAPRPEPLVDPECSVVDIVTLDNRVLDVQPRDVFYLTASGPIGKTGVNVDLGNGEYGIVVRTGSRVPVAYYAPGKYAITCDADGESLKPIQVNVLAPPPDLDKKPKGASPSLNAMTTMAATSSPIGGSVGSVYAGVYPDTNSKFPIRICVSSAGDFTLTKYGGGWSQTWHFDAPGETTDVVDGPKPGENPWTLIKSGGGTHVLSPNSPYKLKINKIRMHSGPAYVAQPRADLTSSNLYLAPSTPIVLVVDPGPGWASNNTSRTDQLYEWKTNNAALPVPCFAVSNLFSFADPGTYVVSVECKSPSTTPIKQSLTINVLKVDLTNIKFNHDTGSSASDALNIRQDYGNAYDISNGEWVKGGTNIPACYTTNKAVTIKARFTVQPASITSADIWALSTDTGGSLGAVIKTNVTFSGGVSSPEYVTFQVSGTTPNCIQKTTNDVWQWKMENVNGTGSAACDLNTSGVHTVYTILNEPVAPWNNAWSAGNNPSNAWSVALDIVCQSSPWAGGTTTIPDAAARVTQAIYNSGRFSYDTAGGACNYTIFGPTAVDYFDASSWVDRLKGGGGLGFSVNCWDCANGVTVMCNVLGCDLWNQWMGSSFVCNEIRAIKDGAWGRPFPPPLGNNGFSYHRVGWRGAVANSSKVFDACLKVDNDGDPTGNGNHNSELIPTDITFWTGSGTFDDYKQMLVDTNSYGNCNVSDTPGGAQNPGRRRDPIR